MPSDKDPKELEQAARKAISAIAEVHPHSVPNGSTWRKLRDAQQALMDAVKKEAAPPPKPITADLGKVPPGTLEKAVKEWQKQPWPLLPSYVTPSPLKEHEHVNNLAYELFTLGRYTYAGLTYEMAEILNLFQAYLDVYESRVGDVTIIEQTPCIKVTVYDPLQDHRFNRSFRLDSVVHFLLYRGLEDVGRSHRVPGVPLRPVVPSHVLFHGYEWVDMINVLIMSSDNISNDRGNRYRVEGLEIQRNTFVLHNAPWIESAYMSFTPDRERLLRTFGLRRPAEQGYTPMRWFPKLTLWAPPGRQFATDHKERPYE